MTTPNYVKSARRLSALILALVLLIVSLYLMSSGDVIPARAATIDSGVQPAADTPTLIVTTTAETATDNCTASSCSLRGAIIAANNRAGDDVIGFGSGVTGKLQLNSALPALDSNIKIIGPGASLLTVQPKTGSFFRLFMINQGVNVTLSGLTVANGFAPDGLGGKAVYNKGTLTVIGCTIAAGASSGNGSGIRNDGTLTVTGTTFSNNGGAQKGGALWNFGKADLSNSFFSNNDAAKGAVVYNEASGQLTVSYGTFGNNSSEFGAGIYNQDGIVRLLSTLFDGNFAQQGAGVFNSARGTVAVDNCVFSKSAGDNIGGASDKGAAIYNDGLFTLNNSTVTKNTAKQDGGGIYNTGYFQVGSGIISSNESGGQGGGIYNSGTLVLEATTVLLNKSTGDGGGISNAADMPGSTGSTITNSCLSNNTGKNGGGINNSATLNLINSTVANNQSLGGGFGGGVYNNGKMQITNSTLSHNAAEKIGEGGGIGANKPLTIQNSIVAENKSPGGGPDVWKTITSNGHNMIGNTQAAVGFDKSKGDLLGVDPRLTAVTNTSGATLFVPLPDSPAIDAGDKALAVQANQVALSTDERGKPRFINSFVDIGAVEVSYAVSAATGSGQSASINTTFAVPLKASVTESGTAISGVTVTFTAPASGPSGAFPGNLRKLTLDTDATGTVTASAFTANASTGGPYNVSASFLAGANFVATTFALTNAKATTATALSSSANPSPAGQAITFTAAVAPGTPGVPTGTVQFSADGVNFGGLVPLNSSGAAMITTNRLAAGRHTVAAQYNGDSSFGPSSSTLTNGQVVGSVLEFNQAVYSASESAGSISIAVTRSGDTTQATSVDYSTDDASVPTIAVACSVVTGHALERCDYTRAAGTLQFAPGETQKIFTVLINDDSYREGTENTSLVLANPGAGAALGPQQLAELQIVDDTQPASNPIDDAAFFVRQHYHDFLNREPDQSGLDFWKAGITSCGTDLNCVAAKRINTSGAFFLSIEFQNTGYFVERIYKTAYGDATGNSTFPSPHQVAVPIVRLREFLSDTQTIGRGVIVGQANWQQQFATNKQTFALEFVSRPRFISALPSTLNAEQFVEQLDTNAGHVLSDSQKAQLKGGFGGPSASSNDAAKRAQALSQVAENQALQDREFNRAFVLMQFFGYLRRNPDEAPDADCTGYDFWLGKLNQFGGDFVKAEMVNAFLLSSEYRSRFGQQ